LIHFYKRLKMSVDLYGLIMSAPCRTVMMTAEMVGVECKFHKVDLFSGENMKPEYLAINPQHSIPALVDGDLKLNESRAIATYLANKYGKDESFYPKDAETRAVVDQRLYFDMGVLYKAFGDIVYPKMFGGAAPEQKQHDRAKEVLGWVNGFVSGGKFVAGTDKITVADIACVATISSIVATGAIDLADYSDVLAWFDKCKDLIPNYEKACGEGATAFGAFYKSKVAA